MTQIKIENALLCQQNTELKNDVLILEERNDKLTDKLAVYRDLDIEEFNRATENYKNIQNEL